MMCTVADVLVKEAQPVYGLWPIWAPRLQGGRGRSPYLGQLAFDLRELRSERGVLAQSRSQSGFTLVQLRLQSAGPGRGGGQVALPLLGAGRRAESRPHQTGQNRGAKKSGKFTKPGQGLDKLPG